MNSFEFAGLPLHVLLVHAVVVLVPLTALAVMLHALWPAARRRLGFVTPLAALAVLVLVPITVSAGQTLETQIVITPAVLTHAALGTTLLPWVIALFAIAVVEWSWYGFVLTGDTTSSRGSSSAAGRGNASPMAWELPKTVRVTSRVVIAVAAVVIATGVLIDVVLIGDAGARAVWGWLFGG